MEFLKPKTSCKTSGFFLNDAMFWRFFWKNINVDVFDDVLQNTKHRANDASNDVNRPPLICNARRHHVRVTVSRDTGPSASGLASTRQPPHRHLKCTWFSQCNAIILTWVQYNTATLQTFANIPPLDNHHHTTWSAHGAPVYIAMLYGALGASWCTWYTKPVTPVQECNALCCSKHSA